MIYIRELQDADMLQAMQLKALCWPEELAGLAESDLNIEKEYAFWLHWMHNGVENNDVRTLLGAFEDNQLLGVAFASFAEDEDSICGIELNGLWVYPNMRGRGISLMLIEKIINYYEHLGKEEIVIYNYHHAPSNAYYRKLGATVYRTEFQMDGKIPTDIFKCDVVIMREQIHRRIDTYKHNYT